MNKLEEYKEIFKANLQIGDEQLEGLTYQSIAAWDSVGHMGLIASIEDTFNVMLDTDDIIEFSSFSKGIEILKKYDVNL
jgi:acyl carrier protein